MSKLQYIFAHARVTNLIWRLECSLLINITLYLLALSLPASPEVRGKILIASGTISGALIAILDMPLIYAYWKYLLMPVIVQICVLISFYIDQDTVQVFCIKLWQIVALVELISCCYVALNILYVVCGSVRDMLVYKSNAEASTDR
jgi:uncharacterized membrane protein